MNRSFFSQMLVSGVLFTSFFNFSSESSAAAYKLDAAHTEIGFSIKHLMISTVKGRFNKFDGGFDYDEKSKSLSKVDIKIESASIDTNDKKRDEHLQSPDFFDTKKVSTIEFKADKISNVEIGKTFKVPGTLTMHGTSKPVSLDVEFKGTATDPWGNEKVVFGATAKIKRADWGMSWNKSLDKGGVVVGEEVTVVIEAEGNKSK
jgi:polyisoprenoid-binding protein YceI